MGSKGACLLRPGITASGNCRGPTNPLFQPPEAAAAAAVTYHYWWAWVSSRCISPLRTREKGESCFMPQNARSGNAGWLGVPEEPSGSRRCCLNQFPRQNQESTALPTVTRALLACRPPPLKGRLLNLSYSFQEKSQRQPKNILCDHNLSPSCAVKGKHSP